MVLVLLLNVIILHIIVLAGGESVLVFLLHVIVLDVIVLDDEEPSSWFWSYCYMHM